MTDKYLMVSLNDEKAKNISEVLGNKTCMKILDLLALKELTESDIANELHTPLNTIDYNVKKLVAAGLIDSKTHFWSVKGKRIPVYKLSNKSILISPKKSSKTLSFIFVALISGITAMIIRSYYLSQEFIVKQAPDLVASTGSASPFSENTAPIANTISPIVQNPAIWFFAGAVFALLIYIIYTKIAERRLK